MTTTHTTSHKTANGPGHAATARDTQRLVGAIDDLIVSRIAQMREPGTGAEESDKSRLALIEHFKRLFG